MRRSALIFAVLGLLAVPGCSSGRDNPTHRPPEHQPSEVPKGVGAVGEEIHHTLGFEDASHHYMNIRTVFPAPANTEVELSMATWTPGSYLMREYARHIEDLRFASASGTSLQASKTSKNRWRIKTGAAPGLVAEYKVYGRELSVRTNFVDADVAVINGAPTFLTMVEDTPRAHALRLELPEGWQDAVTGLDRAEGANSFRARTYDELVDSPIVAGRELVTNKFEIGGIPHWLVHLGDTSQWDLEEAAADVEHLARAQARFWGVVPYEHYHFLNVLLGGGGGLEHLDSTLMMASPFSSRTTKRYQRWLGLVAHEFFHAWNVKRLRPRSLGPFDYENENYTRSLWIAEGITSYYDDLLLRRSGLIDEDEYLERLGNQLRGLQETPGRLVQPLSQASYDAWIKYYRRDENSRNTSISYYTKGAVVAFLLDVEIRTATGGSKSLDDLMRLLYQRYSGAQGYTPEQFRETASEVAGVDLGPFLARAVDTTAELDYSTASAYYGLDLSVPEQSDDEESDDEESDDEDEDDPAGWLGLRMSDARVRSVKRNTPAYEAGINVDDEILAIDGYHNSGALSALLAKFRPGQKVKITLARRGRLREIDATLQEEPEKRWSLKVAPGRSRLQELRYEHWLEEYPDL